MMLRLSRDICIVFFREYTHNFVSILTSSVLRMAPANEGSHSLPPTRLSTNGMSHHAFDP